MDRQIHVLPGIEHGELKNSFRRTAEPTHQRIPPTINLDHVLGIEEMINRFLWRDHIVMGYLNADIGRLQNPQNQQVADFLASFRLVDLLNYL